MSFSMDQQINNTLLGRCKIIFYTMRFLRNSIKDFCAQNFETYVFQNLAKLTGWQQTPPLHSPFSSP